MTQYAIRELGPDEPGGFAPRGGALKLWQSKHPEVMLSGPSETGKTYSSLQKLDALMWKYPGSTAVIVRKTMSSIYGTVLRTYKNVLGPDTPVRFYGGEKPEWADYPNRSRVYIAGMDNPQKALSSERDFIYVNQAEELSLNDWETLTTRCTGRAAVAPYSQIFGDCNPGAPTHWIKHRPRLFFLESRHEDNPTLFDAAGNITDRGRRTLDTLDALTGVRKARLRYGRWVQAEGVVYEGWDATVHVIDALPTIDGRVPPFWKRYRSIDFGYNDPFVCQWWCQDPESRLYLYREIYHTRRTVRVHAEQIRDVEGWYDESDEPDPRRERITSSVADHDREDRATLEEEGVDTVPADKAIEPGLQAVMERLKPSERDGKPRLFVVRNAVVEVDQELAAQRMPCCTQDEFDCYVWKVDRDGKPVKEEPLDRFNHGMDAMRYMVRHVDGPTGSYLSDAARVEREPKGPPGSRSEQPVDRTNTSRRDREAQEHPRRRRNFYGAR